MKVLWITNIMLPPICRKLGSPVPVISGWLYSSAKSLINNHDNIHLAVATVYDGNELLKHTIDDIDYYLLPLHGDNQKYHSELESIWRRVDKDFNPDLVHLHGTEYAHGLAYLNACPSRNNVVSIQGLVSVISRYYLAGMTFKEILTSITLRDILRMDTLWQSQRFFVKRGEIEKQIIKRANHIIGRTSWDKSQCWAINSSAKYHFCNETLRNSFYEHKWSYENCQPHSIFISQAGYPLKGFHQVLKAMPYVLKYFPDTVIYVAGQNIFDTSSLKQKLKQCGYAKYISKIIKKHNLQNVVKFTGPLDEEQICNYYLKSNLFICPSSIENSPNSLGEAQLLEMPYLASFVGGIPDMMKGSESFLYRFEEIEMLANKICDIFQAKNNVSFSTNESKQRHDKTINSKRLIEIYKEIV